jgi:hypothetical protein
VFVKVGFVMHDYFPARYFKYILIGVALGVATWILVYLLRAVAFPKRDWLLKQYREAYERFVCPVCSYPIRRGPLKYLSWTRRSIKKTSIVAAPMSEGAREETYVCPCCGTGLYETCTCGAVRHSLLPTCQYCGQTRE